LPACDMATRDNDRLHQTQSEVDQVVGIMRQNVEKVLERDQKLTDLQDKSDALESGAQRFSKNATKLKRKYWWQNMKMMLILGLVVVIIIVIIAVIATQAT
jgi:vesicle-associated membrane protein 2